MVLSLGEEEDGEVDIHLSVSSWHSFLGVEVFLVFIFSAMWHLVVLSLAGGFVD